MNVSAKSDFTVEPVTTEEGLSRIEEDWNRLSETSAEPNVFMTFDWFRAWNQRFAQEDRSGQRSLSVLALKRDGAVAGISPLVQRTASRFGLAVRKMEFLGGHADYNDLVLGNDPAGQSKAIADFLVRTQDTWDLVDLRDLRETGNSLALIEGALSNTDLLCRIIPESDRCPYMPIVGESTRAIEKLSGHVRRTLRKRMERAKALGLRVRIIENPQDEHGLVERMMALEAQKRAGGRLVPPFIGKYREVFQLLFDTLGPRRWVYVALMELDNRPVAWQLGFRCGKRLWDYNKAYDHTFSRYAPGTLLVAALLDYGFLHAYDEYDFLRGVESYKTRWTNDYHQTFRLMIWNRRWTSRARAFTYLDLKSKVYGLLGRAI
jgi:CelD/BcsL family acetyltransferase involved in cellulose biosynthesis